MSKLIVSVSAAGLALLLTPVLSARPPQLPLPIKIICAPEPEKYTQPATTPAVAPVAVPAAESASGEVPAPAAPSESNMGDINNPGLAGAAQAPPCLPNPLYPSWYSFVQILSGRANAPQQQPVCPMAEAVPADPMNVPGQIIPVQAFPAGPAPAQTLPFFAPPPMPAQPNPQVLPAGAPVPAARTTEPPLHVSPVALKQLRQRAEIRQLYQQAERFMQGGELEPAYHCYEEIHLRSPNCRYGQVASEKMAEIERQQIAGQAPLWPSRPLAEAATTTRVTPVSATRAITTPPRTPGELYLSKLSQAQKMFHIAERCRRQGDMDKAYTCYHETIRLCPASDYAHWATQHIRQIDSLRNNNSEPAETDEPLRLQKQSRSSGLRNPRTGTQQRQELEIEADIPPTRVNRPLPDSVKSGLTPAGTFTPAPEPARETRDHRQTNHVTRWTNPELATVLGLDHAEFEMDQSSRGMRVLGGINLGVLGCRVIYQDGRYSVSVSPSK